MELPKIDAARVKRFVLKRTSGWDEVRFGRALNDYLHFLELCRQHPTTRIGCPADADVVWHAHMLDSVHYSSDCQRIFGDYLHHDPQAEECDEAVTRQTRELFARTFGAQPTGDWLRAMTCDPPRNTAPVPSYA